MIYCGTLSIVSIVIANLANVVSAIVTINKVMRINVRARYGVGYNFEHNA